ncbi:DNA-processing protein DprA [Cryobacterium sp. SO1]|uniref:DNA-processing protein DprA n=1 Tax=Cryobacterium sp. SO1 TaxID=1897061 RepID=UPI001022E3F0|nr:DNA-processing protein DprA [Cryobacterium sp. SO1]RZI34554.1 hypothetical protein BJQ95_03012 [Cryobacterium sp. SO1]
MESELLSLKLALLAFGVLRTPARIAAALKAGGRDAIAQAARAAESSMAANSDLKASQLHSDGVRAVIYGDSDFPGMLVANGKPLAPVLFFKGNKDLLYSDGVGMCGSRHASRQGLIAADRCGAAVSLRDLTIVSGYAKGVDTATHLAALQNGGRTVIVLAEGIDHFRIKREFAEDFDPERTLVISQFSPTQPWQAHAAMARNSIIFGLSRALVVIEAGEKGGTLAAGEGAMKLGRPVMVVDFGDATPAGNRMLLEAGATPIRAPGALHAFLDNLPRGPMTDSPVELF